MPRGGGHRERDEGDGRRRSGRCSSHGTRGGKEGGAGGRGHGHGHGHAPGSRRTDLGRRVKRPTGARRDAEAACVRGGGGPRGRRRCRPAGAPADRAGRRCGRPQVAWPRRCPPSGRPCRAGAGAGPAPERRGAARGRLSQGRASRRTSSTARRAEQGELGGTGDGRQYGEAHHDRHGQVGEHHRHGPAAGGPSRPAAR